MERFSSPKEGCLYAFMSCKIFSINCFFSYKFPVTTKHSCQIAFSGFDMMASRSRENSKNYSADNLKITKVLTFPHSDVLIARLRNMKWSNLMNLNIRIVFCFNSKLKGKTFPGGLNMQAQRSINENIQNSILF